ncbi:MAG: hypothetical protein ACXWPM_07260 [Bdellovibrionota bacterium]
MKLRFATFVGSLLILSLNALADDHPIFECKISGPNGPLIQYVAIENTPDSNGYPKADDPENTQLLAERKPVFGYKKFMIPTKDKSKSVYHATFQYDDKIYGQPAKQEIRVYKDEEGKLVAEERRWVGSDPLFEFRMKDCRVISKSEIQTARSNHRGEKPTAPVQTGGNKPARSGNQGGAGR